MTLLLSYQKLRDSRSFGIVLDDETLLVLVRESEILKKQKISLARHCHNCLLRKFSNMEFSPYFRTSTGQQPYAYQKALAESNCSSRLISVPTGMGKTAAVIHAWLWNRVHMGNSDFPRRLVYCLPMRTLVEQTYSVTENWLKTLGILWDGRRTTHSGNVGLHVLMGGEDATGWDLYPEENAILIGTQDMLLSRALNRGYGMSRFRWPMHYGLLNRACPRSDNR